MSVRTRESTPGSVKSLQTQETPVSFASSYTYDAEDSPPDRPVYDEAAQFAAALQESEKDAEYDRIARDLERAVRINNEVDAGRSPLAAVNENTKDKSSNSSQKSKPKKILFPTAAIKNKKKPSPPKVKGD